MAQKRAKNGRVDKRAKGVLEKLREMKHEKKRCTLYLKKNVFSDLSSICKHEKQSISQIVEVLIEDFIASYKKENGNGHKIGR